MATLKGLKQLSKALERLKEIASEVQNNLDEKREWMNEKSDKWQESEAGQEWESHLSDVENLLNEIDGLEVPGIDVD